MAFSYGECFCSHPLNLTLFPLLTLFPNGLELAIYRLDICDNNEKVLKIICYIKFSLFL